MYNTFNFYSTIPQVVDIINGGMQFHCCSGLSVSFLQAQDLGITDKNHRNNMILRSRFQPTEKRVEQPDMGLLQRWILHDNPIHLQDISQLG